MDTKFTKGEWVANIEQQEVIGHATNPYIADILDSGMGKDEVDANVHLIAAAPAMYKLLEKFLPMDEDGNGWDFQYNEGSEEMGQDVINLLAKARGE